MVSDIELTDNKFTWNTSHETHGRAFWVYYK